MNKQDQQKLIKSVMDDAGKCGAWGRDSTRKGEKVAKLIRDMVQVAQFDLQAAAVAFAEAGTSYGKGDTKSTIAGAAYAVFNASCLREFKAALYPANRFIELKRNKDTGDVVANHGNKPLNAAQNKWVEKVAADKLTDDANDAAGGANSDKVGRQAPIAALTVEEYAAQVVAGLPDGVTVKDLVAALTVADQSGIEADTETKTATK